MFGFWCLIEMKISDNQTSRPLCITNAKHAAPGSRLPAPGYLAPAANPRERRKPRPSILHFALHARKKRRPWERLSFSDWCGWRDLNSHGYSHYRLKIARLPVPPQPRGREAVGSQVSISCEPTFPLFRWSTTIFCGAAGET